MKSVIPAENKVVVKETEKPTLKEGEILVKLKACGICGSDIEKVYGSYGMVSKRIGHELAGIVEESKNKKFSKGDRVFVHHHVPCYSCYYCKKEDHILCEVYQKSNVEPNGLAEFFVVPEHNVEKGGVIKIPDKMSFEEASMIEPLACCLKAVNKLNVKKDENVVVIGAGPAGILNAMQEGASGIDMGRNIWQHDYPIAMIKAIRAIVHKDATPREAMDIFRETKSEKEEELPTSVD